MAKTEKADFEALWALAQSEPETKTVIASNPIAIDLSIDNILDRYTSFVHKAANANKISESRYQALLDRTTSYKNALDNVDGGSLLKEIRNLTSSFNPFR